MSLKNAIDNLKFDARMLDINLKNQTLTPEEIKKHLSQLPDSKDLSMNLDLNDVDLDKDSMNGQGGEH